MPLPAMSDVLRGSLVALSAVGKIIRFSRERSVASLPFPIFEVQI